MFTSRLNQHNDKLTYSERLISNLLMSSFGMSENSKMMTSEEISLKVGCGQATVIRFSQKLGYPSFKSMMMDLTNDAILYCENEVSHNESTHSIMGKLQNLYTTTVMEALSNNRNEDIEYAVDLFEKAGTIFCFGVRSSFAMASLMYYRLLEIDRSVLMAENLLESVSMVRNLRENDVVFIVSTSGETSEVLSIIKAAQISKAKIISITEGSDNSTQRSSEVALKCTEYNLHTDELNFVNRTSQLFLIDCIFIKLWRKNETKFLEGARSIKKNLDDDKDDVLNNRLTFRL